MFYPDSTPDGLIRIHTPGLKTLTRVRVTYGEAYGWDTLDSNDYPVGVIIGCALINSQFGQLQIPGDSIITIAFSLGPERLQDSPLGYTFTVSLFYSDLTSETYQDTNEVAFPTSELTVADFSSCPSRATTAAVPPTGNSSGSASAEGIANIGILGKCQPYFIPYLFTTTSAVLYGHHNSIYVRFEHTPHLL